MRERERENDIRIFYRHVIYGPHCTSLTKKKS